MKAKISNNIYANSSPEGDSLEIYVMEEIGENWWTGGGVTKQSILNDIKGRKIKDIVLNISSPGGNVDDALAIKDMLLNTGSPITAKVSGLTASAATIIMMCAGTIEMSEDSMILIHCASTWGGGNKGDLRKTADTLEMIDNVIAGLYSKKSGKDIAVCLAEMEKDQWMTPAQAKELGIVDNITSAVPVTNATRVMIQNAVKANLIKLPEGYSITDENQNSNDMTDKTATSFFNKFINLLEKNGISLTSNKKDLNVKETIKNVTTEFKAEAEKILNEETPAAPTPTIENTADYSATVTEAVNSIELADNTTLSLPNVPYEVSADGATALQTDLTAAVTATSVSVTFDEAATALTISVTQSEQDLATVNGTIEFTTGASGSGDKTENLSAEDLRKEIANLKEQKKNGTKPVENAAEIAKLIAERDKLKNELKVAKGGKSGGAAAGEGIGNNAKGEGGQGVSFVKALANDYLKSR